MSFCSKIFIAASARNPEPKQNTLRNARKKVGQVGQVPVFIGFCEGLKLTNLANFTRSRHLSGRARFHPSRLLLSQGADKSSKSHQILEKSWPTWQSWPSSLFCRVWHILKLANRDQLRFRLVFRKARKILKHGGTEVTEKEEQEKSREGISLFSIVADL